MYETGEIGVTNLDINADSNMYVNNEQVFIAT